VVTKGLFKHQVLEVRDTEHVRANGANEQYHSSSQSINRTSLPIPSKVDANHNITHNITLVFIDRRFYGLDLDHSSNPTGSDRTPSSITIRIVPF
jgi:hypothetical protein